MARTAHGVIQVDDEFIVVGGTTYDFGNNGLVETESCKLLKNSKGGDYMTCILRDPGLWDFTRYPELFILP